MARKKPSTAPPPPAPAASPPEPAVPPEDNPWLRHAASEPDARDAREAARRRLRALEQNRKMAETDPSD
jgi:hypothetical protein